MSQADVIELLEKMDRPLAVGEIAKLLNDNQKKISKDLNKMLKYNEVIFEEIDRFMAMEKYHCKKRMRLWSANGDC